MRPLARNVATRSLGVPALLSLILAAVGCVAPPVEEPADLVLVDGAVYTVDEERPWAEAMAVRDGRILAVGDSDAIEALAGPDTRRIDLGGAFVSPGFNDGHVHTGSTGALILGVNLLDVHDEEGFVERIRGATERMPAGSAITRGSWGAYEQWEAGSAGETRTDAVAEPFTPHRDMVDDFTAEHPVLVSKFDGSMHLANSTALELAGVDASSAGEGFERGDDGRLTGVITGADAYRRVAAALPDKSFEQRMAEFRAVMQEARQGGVTTIQDLTSAEMLRVYQEAWRNGELTLRIMLRPTLYDVDHVAALGITRGFGDDWMKFIGYKAWVDGIMGSSSALFFQPYDHQPDNSGRLRDIMFPEGREGWGMEMTVRDDYTDAPPGNLELQLEKAVPTGIPPHVHAIGDKGVRILLDIYEKLLTEHDMVDSDHRWRVIHAQVLHPEDFEHFGELNLVAEVNPYHVSDDMRWMEERIGAERSQGAYAFRDLKDAGAVLVFGSDSPGTNAARYYLHPKYGLYAAVSRQTLSGEPEGGWFPDQRLTAEEAIEAYTLNPAWASFEEDIKGSLTPGKLADIAVFDTNLVDAGNDEPARLLDAEVLYTIVGGEVVYEAEGPAGR